MQTLIVTIAPVTGQWPLTGRTEELEAISAAMRRVPGTGGVVLSGAAGVGKTRLADETLTRVARRQLVRKVVGTDSARSLPLGAFAEWLPTGKSDSVHAARGVIEALVGHDSGSSVLIVVDDAHLLDDVSAFVVHQLVSRRLAPIVLTIRSGATAPDTVTALWKDGYLNRFDVQPLSRAETIQLAETVLGTSLDPIAAQQIWRLTQGNALYLRHLVEQEPAGGWSRLASGGRTSKEQTAIPTSIGDLIVSEMGTLSSDLVNLLDILAVAEPLDITLLSRLVDATVLEEAEGRGLVSVEHSSMGGSARLAHPMYGEVRRARAGTLRLRRIRGQVAELFATAEVKRPDDLLRYAVMILESDREPDPAISLQAATEAILVSDYSLAERLSRSAGSGFEAGMVHLLALMHLWDAEDAENEVAHFQLTNVSDDQRAQISVVRALNLLLMLGRPMDAQDILHTAMEPSNSAETQGAITAVQSLLYATQGRPQVAIETARSALAKTEHLGPDTMVALCGLVAGLGDRGRIEEVRNAASRGYEIGQYFWLAEGLRFYLADLHQRYLLCAGYVAESEVVVSRISGQFIDVPGNTQVWTTTYQAHAALGAGRLNSARLLFRQILAGRQASRGWEYRYKHELAQTLAMLGRSVDANEVLQGCMEEFPASSVIAEPLFLLSQAWVSAASGTVTEAIRLARTAADLAKERTQIAPEVICLQTATQLGDDTTAPRLAELAKLVEGPRAPIASAYAHALAVDNAGGLNRASARFEEMGDRVAAIDAAAQAANSFVRANRRGSAFICLERAQRLATECGGVSTPALRQAGTSPKLTPRQREIVQLANEGLSNKQIADRIQVSVRTVEGHLYRAGIKTGACGRTELGRTLRGE